MKKRHFVLALLSILSTIVYLDRVCISVSGKRIKTDLGLSNEQFGWVLGAFALSYALFEIPTGIMGDRNGPRKVLASIVLLWSGFTALRSLAFNFVYLLIVRFLFGAGEAGAYPNSSIVIARWFPKYETGGAQAFIWAFGRIGGALAPLIVVPLAMAFGWRLSFAVMGGIGLVWVIVWWLVFKNEPREVKTISPAELNEIESNRRFRGINNHAVPWKKLLANRNVLALMGMFHFFMYGAFFFSSWLPTYLQEGRHFSESDMKFFAAMPFALGAIGCFTGGYASDWLAKKWGLKMGRRAVGMVSMLLSAVIILMAALSVDNQRAAILLAIGMAVKDFTLPVAFATCVDIGKSRSGVVSGTMNMAGQLGAFFLAVLFGKVVDMTGNYNIPLFFIAGVLVLGGLLWLIIDAGEPVFE